MVGSLIKERKRREGCDVVWLLTSQSTVSHKILASLGSLLWGVFFEAYSLLIARVVYAL